MNNNEKTDLIIQLFDWQKAYDRHCENKCFLLNFGYKKHLPFPQIEMSLDQDSVDFVNIGNYGNIFSNECSFVVIGGKYLNKTDEVMRMVDQITDDIIWMPSAVFLMKEKPGQDIKFTVSTRHRRSPTMFQVPSTRSSVVQFVMTCPGSWILSI